MNKKITILLLLISFGLITHAQTIGDYMDVIYLKNGSKIKGVIIEQIPGKSVRIKTEDNSELVYQIAEIEKFVREEVNSTEKIDIEIKKSKPDSLKFMNNFKKKRKGYFANIDVLFGTSPSGLRVTNGYRFGRFGNIGLAVGIENIELNRNSPLHSSLYYPSKEYTALSLNLVYSGELLDKRITPFYQFELGYGFSLNRTGYAGEEDFYTYVEDAGVFFNYGGPMSASVLGVKFATKRKIAYKLALDMRFVSNFSDNHSNYIDDLGNTIPTLNKEFNVNSSVGFRFGIEF